MNTDIGTKEGKDNWVSCYVIVFIILTFSTILLEEYILTLICFLVVVFLSFFNNYLNNKYLKQEDSFDENI